MSKKPGYVRFVVEFEDGSEALMTIDLVHLRSGDHVARIMAGEEQRRGELPNKPIRTVRRAPYGIQP